MKNILLLSIVALSILGCSKEDDPAPPTCNTVRFMTNNETLTISISGASPYMPNPRDCQDITLRTDNAFITSTSPLFGIEHKTNYHWLCPLGMIKSVYVTPNVGYRLDGWYCNGVPLVDMSVPFMSAPVIVNAVMLPVAAQ
jgi:hypothetical protein